MTKKTTTSTTTSIAVLSTPTPPPAKVGRKGGYNLYVKTTTSQHVERWISPPTYRNRGEVVDAAIEALALAKWKPGMKLRAILSTK